MPGRWIVGGFAIALFVSSAALEAQLPRPLIPMPDEGLRVVPTFDGWYQNPDGTVSFSFGYSNLNKAAVEIPFGPNNFIVPKEYDGRQPTVFSVIGPENQDGATPAGATAGAATGTAAAAGAGATAGAPAPDGAAARAAGAGGGGGIGRDRARGVFTVTVPAAYKGDVVWTLRHAGQTWSVPARSKSVNYMLSWPMAMGSVPPLLRFQSTGKAGRGPTGIQAPAQQAKVGAPLPLTVWITDDGAHEKEPITIKPRGVVAPPMNVSWEKYAGPVGAAIGFDPPKSPLTESVGTASTKATFKEPGEYTLRVVVDTFGMIDSSSGNQCCWTNGYVKVSVTR